MSVPNFTATKMAMANPIAVILKPISSATGALTTLANSSASQVLCDTPEGQFRLPVETPTLLCRRASANTTTKREDPTIGIIASQLGNVLGLEPGSRDRSPEMKPPFAVAAFAKQITNTITERTTSHRALVSTGIRNIRRNASTTRGPVRVPMVEPRGVEVIIAAP